MTFACRLVCFGMMFLASLIFPNDAVSQSAKKLKTTDGFGPIAGVNFILFYPKEQFIGPVNAGNPEILPGGMIGLSYHHAFSPRWSHIFQLRLTDHQIKYWRKSEQNWYVNHEWVPFKSDSGDYHIHYKVVSMNYLIGWCLNRKVGWNIYSGLQLNYTINNQSTKTVDRVVYGKVVSHEFVPYPEPIYYFDETSETYSQGQFGEVLLRTDFKLKLNDQWTIRPSLEYGINTGRDSVLSRDRLAFYVEMYKTL